MEQVSENHKAVVVSLKGIRPHSNADRLRLVTIFGNQVVIGLKEEEGDLGLYFNSDLRISTEFGQANDLFRRKDDQGNNAGGMFDENGKVRCQKFRKEQSDGFWIPLNSLEFTDGKIDSLKDGDSFQEFNGVKICEKYIVPGKGIQNAPKKKVKKYESVMFPKHIDTSHLMKHLGDIDLNDNIVITEKLHGCVEENTIVETLEFGEITIGEVVNNKLECHIKAFDTLTNEIIFVPVNAFYKIENDGEWYEIELEDGKTITITGNNPVWLPNEKCYRRVDELNGDELLLID